MTEQTRVRLKIEIAFTKPSVWRRVEAPGELSLPELHKVISALFEWKGYHLYEFHAGDKRYGVLEPDNELHDAIFDHAQVRLKDIINDGITSLTYTYDFGDDWLHHIEIEAVEPSSSASSIKFLDGARRGPPEDIGGPPGFEVFLEALADRSHPEHREMRRVVGQSYDPGLICPEKIQGRLSEIR